MHGEWGVRERERERDGDRQKANSIAVVDFHFIAVTFDTWGKNINGAIF